MTAFSTRPVVDGARRLPPNAGGGGRRALHAGAGPTARPGRSCRVRGAEAARWRTADDLPAFARRSARSASPDSGVVVSRTAASAIPATAVCVRRGGGLRAGWASSTVKPRQRGARGSGRDGDGGQGRPAREAAFWAEDARCVGLPEVQRPGDGSPFGVMLDEIAGVAAGTLGLALGGARRVVVLDISAERLATSATGCASSRPAPRRPHPPHRPRDHPCDVLFGAYAFQHLGLSALLPLLASSPSGLWGDPAGARRASTTERPREWCGPRDPRRVQRQATMMPAGASATQRQGWP